MTNIVNLGKIIRLLAEAQGTCKGLAITMENVWTKKHLLKAAKEINEALDILCEKELK